MKWILVAFTLLLAVPGSLPAWAQTPPATSMTPTPDERARQWLTLVDDGNYADAYKQAGAPLQSRISANSFGQKFGVARTPFGAMSSRTLKNVKLSKTIPGMPDGQYAVIQYDSAFAHKASAIETITLSSDKNGWSVVGYIIK